MAYLPPQTAALLAAFLAVWLTAVAVAVAARRRAEALRRVAADLTALVENAGGPAWAVDRDLRLVTFNSHFRDTYTRAAGAAPRAGADALEPLTSEARARWAGWFARALAGERFAAEYHSDDGGEARCYEVSFRPIVAGGAVAGVSAFSRDVTERARAGAELRQAKEAAEAASRAAGELLARMCHAIRTPLSDVLGTTEVLLDTHLTAEQREYLEVLRSSADALLAVVNDASGFPTSAGAGGPATRPSDPVPGARPAAAEGAPVSPSALTGAALDRAALLERLGGDAELVREVAELYLHESPRLLGAARAALAGGDAPALARAAHSLKGTLTTLAAPRASTAALRLEQLGARGDLAGAAAALPELERCLEELGAGLDALRRGER
jgi:HPt (histidine-containing phosphotransfer) domain-containing protein/PAS domain-containing protein